MANRVPATTTVFVKILTAPKSYRSKTQVDMFRVMVAVRGEEKGLTMVGQWPKASQLEVNSCFSITKCNKGDSGVTLTADSVVSESTFVHYLHIHIL